MRGKRRVRGSLRVLRAQVRVNERYKLLTEPFLRLYVFAAVRWNGREKSVERFFDDAYPSTSANGRALIGDIRSALYVM
jgi:hypothetical protein